MNDLLNTLQNVTESFNPFLLNFEDSREIKEITERLERSIQHCLSEAYQSLFKQKNLIEICLNDLDYAQTIWENQPRLLEIPSSQTIEEIGKLSSSILNITKLIDQIKTVIFLKLKDTWESELEQLRKEWFVNKEGQMKKGIGWGEKDNFIKGISENTENKNQYIKKFEQEVIDSLEPISSQFWGDLTWEKVTDTSSEYISILEIFLEDLFTQAEKTITLCFEKLLSFYDIFLSKQKCYQEEKPEQLEVKQQWINAQRSQLETLQKSIEEILSQNSSKIDIQITEIENSSEETFNSSKSNIQDNETVRESVPLERANIQNLNAPKIKSLSFEVILESVPSDQKIASLKIIRAETGLGLKETKNLVESTPSLIKKVDTEATANRLKQKIEGTGAKVSIKTV